MLRSDYNETNSGHVLYGEHSHFGSSSHSSYSSPSSTMRSIPSPTSAPDFEELFNQDLTPNKRAIMETVLTAWIENPPSNRDLRSDRALSSSRGHRLSA